MFPSFRRAITLASVVGAAFALAAGASSASAADAEVHIRGTAYAFSHTLAVMAGGVVQVAEYPELQAKVAADGSYDIAVPDRADVTLYATAPGYHPIYTQTFHTDGADLERVNFQTPPDSIYRALAAILHAPMDADGNPKQCVIVSTIVTKNVRDLGFKAFVAYGAHGVAGATGLSTPALSPPTYFNKIVIPDITQKLSSPDGGVVWANVPAGTYRISATHPTKRFASFDATCVPGRVVNANPPWGLHELASDNPVKAKAGWSKTTQGATLRSLTLSKLKVGSVVTVGCTGDGCAPKRKVITAKKPTLDVRKALGARATFSAGQSLTVQVRTHAVNGKVFGWAIAPGTTPRATTQCLPLGDRKAVTRC